MVDASREKTKHFLKQLGRLFNLASSFNKTSYVLAICQGRGKDGKDSNFCLQGARGIVELVALDHYRAGG